MSANDYFGLRSNRVVLDDGLYPATVVVRDGVIEAVHRGLVIPACRVEDLGELILMPGLVDTHVHINEPGRTEWEGFNSATRSAAAGGITTVVDMPLNCIPVTTSADALATKIDSLAGKLWIDCGFWGGVVPQSLDSLAALIEAGVLGVKSFMIESGVAEFPRVQEQDIRAAIPILAEYQIPYLIHAELDNTHGNPVQIGTSYHSFLKSRPPRWENDAIALMIRLCREARQKSIESRIHIVHLSSADAIAGIAGAKADGLAITAESCPHYLTLSAEDIQDGATLFKCCPPIREEHNRERLWQGLADGVVDFIVSDHSPCSLQLKRADSGDFAQAWGGISSLQFGLSIVWTEARRRGYSLPRVADWMCSGPAQFAGLGRRKGRIAPGFDADLVVFNDKARYTIQSHMIKYRHKFTPYEGRIVTGRVQRTYVRGNKVYADGDLLGEPQGRPIFRIPDR